MTRVNLYTKLIDINNRFIFESYYNDMIDCGNVLVNDKKPDDINMNLNNGDILKVFNNEYTISL